MRAFRIGGARRCRLPRVALLALAALITSCGATTGSSLTKAHATVTANAPARLANSAWERIALPVPSDQVHGFAVSPGDPDLLFACTADIPLTLPDPNPHPPAPRPFTLWRSADAGAHWSEFALPGAEGTTCAFSVAPDEPRRVTFQVSAFSQDAQLCSQDALYLSTDGGASWRRLSHQSVAPDRVSYGWCDLHATARHLFMAYS